MLILVEMVGREKYLRRLGHKSHIVTFIQLDIPSLGCRSAESL